MRNIRVCIYGGTDFQGTPVEFVSELAYQILKSMPAVIVTGGFVHSSTVQKAVSTDVAALNGARRYADEQRVALKTCYEAWIPELLFEGGADVEGIVRMTEKDGITVKVMTERTTLGRHLAMVAGVDMVITISGRRHTEMVVEQALELRLPTLPLPDAGGDSRLLLQRYRQRIDAGFEPGALETCLAAVSAAIDGNPAAAAGSVIELIRAAKVGKCLVLLPFDGTHDALYEKVIAPAVARHMVPLRLDRLPTSEVIPNSLAKAIQSCAAIVADVTIINENVMYEVGFALGSGHTPLIYTRKSSRLHRLPIYFSTMNVKLATARIPVNVLVDDYLRAVKASRRARQIPA